MQYSVIVVAEKLVTSPRKLFIFILRSKYLWDQSIPIGFYLSLKTKSLVRYADSFQVLRFGTLATIVTPETRLLARTAQYDKDPGSGFSAAVGTAAFFGAAFLKPSILGAESAAVTAQANGASARARAGFGQKNSMIGTRQVCVIDHTFAVMQVTPT